MPHCPVCGEYIIPLPGMFGIHWLLFCDGGGSDDSGGEDDTDNSTDTNE